ncbi:hypothetical protein [Lentzea sp. CA-135723]|uniref:hypothetical protein n=1 Tax=Lentzea sp. CA-135723 TaxID=3239950 RepID=UPI003D920F92
MTTVTLTDDTDEAEYLATLAALAEPTPTWQACGCVPLFPELPRSGPEIPLARKELAS